MHQKLRIPRLTTLTPPPTAFSEGRSLKHPLRYRYLLPKVGKEPFRGKLQWDQSADNPLSERVTPLRLKKQLPITMIHPLTVAPNMKLNQARRIICVRIICVQITPQNQNHLSIGTPLIPLTECSVLVVGTPLIDNARIDTQPRIVAEVTPTVRAKKTDEKDSSLTEVAKAMNIVLDFSDKILLPPYK